MKNERYYQERYRQSCLDIEDRDERIVLLLKNEHKLFNTIIVLSVAILTGVTMIVF